MKNKSFIESLKNAFTGIKLAFKSERNIKIHFFFVGVVLIALIIFKIRGLELAIIFLTIGLVIVSELMNSAIEKCVDLIQPEYHVIAGYVKDVAAAAVLVAAFIAILVGIIIFGPRMLQLIR